MAFLEIENTTIPCTLSATASSTVVRQGPSGRADSGRWSSAYRRKAREWSFTTAPLTPAEAASLKLLIDGGDVLTASGDFCAPDTSVLCIGEVGESEMLRLAEGLHETFSFALREI